MYKKKEHTIQIINLKGSLEGSLEGSLKIEK